MQGPNKVSQGLRVLAPSEPDVPAVCQDCEPLLPTAVHLPYTGVLVLDTPRPSLTPWVPRGPIHIPPISRLGYAAGPARTDSYPSDQPSQFLIMSVACSVSVSSRPARPAIAAPVIGKAPASVGAARVF